MASLQDRHLNPDATEFVPLSSPIDLFHQFAALQLEGEDDTDFGASGSVMAAIQYVGHKTIEPCLLYEPIAPIPDGVRNHRALRGKCQKLEQEATSLGGQFNSDAAHRLLAIMIEFPWHAGSAYTVGTQTTIFGSIRTWLKLAYRRRYHSSTELGKVIVEIVRAVQLCRGFNEAQKFEARKVVGLTAKDENMTSLWRLWPWRALNCRDNYDPNVLKIFARIHTIALTEPRLPFHYAAPFAYAEGVRRATSNDLTMQDAGAMELLTAHTMAKRAVFLEYSECVTFDKNELVLIKDWFRLIDEFKKDRRLYGAAAAGMYPWQLRPLAYENDPTVIFRQESFPYHGTRGPVSDLTTEPTPPRQTMKSGTPSNPPKPARLVDGFLPPPPKSDELCMAGLPTWQPESNSEGLSIESSSKVDDRDSGSHKDHDDGQDHAPSSFVVDPTLIGSKSRNEGETKDPLAFSTPRKSEELRAANIDWWHERPLLGHTDGSIQPLSEKPLANSRQKQHWSATPLGPGSADQRGWGVTPDLRSTAVNDSGILASSVQGINTSKAEHTDTCPQPTEKGKNYLELNKKSDSILRGYVYGASGERTDLEERSHKDQK